VLAVSGQADSGYYVALVDRASGQARILGHLDSEPHALALTARAVYVGGPSGLQLLAR
jgi:hypothetical protein